MEYKPFILLINKVLNSIIVTVVFLSAFASGTMVGSWDGVSNIDTRLWAE